MTVTASFEPEQVVATPGDTSSLSLHLQNTGSDETTVTLKRTGDLVDHIGLASESVRLEPGEHFEVPVIIDPLERVTAGTHSCTVEVTEGESTTTASASIDVASVTGWTATLQPVRSLGAAKGRHKIAIDNVGNAPVSIDLMATSDSTVATEFATSSVTIEAHSSTRVAMRVVPEHLFWNGATIEHPVTVTVIGGGDQVVLEGIYEQGPRLRPWTAPALAGMLGALLIGLLAWFVIFKPAVEDIAEEQAEQLDQEQQAVLDERVDEIQAAADEASRLPLGNPTDLRMDVTATAATTSSEAFDFDKEGNGRVLSITDVIFQNPTGAVGRVELLRDDQVLLDQEMANFRDLDFHLVAPLRVDSESTIALRLTCEEPGPGTSECEAAATIIGFVDDL
ncbi:COG1470 family protein [Ilumatobacter nonamiensis]|uniref:COG1470 family protein n=1 Tax=Ilumatobacter nonamiensis TaxID=467093 RepID=UPI000344DB1C|nr:hypothetical protein [Ilumatobacter nonamiensis]